MDEISAPYDHVLGFSCRYQSFDHILNELATTPLERMPALLNLSPILEFWTRNAAGATRGKTIWIFVRSGFAIQIQATTQIIRDDAVDAVQTEASAALIAARREEQIERFAPDATAHTHSLNVGSMHPPQTQGKVQSAVRLALSGMCLFQESARTGSIDRQMTSKIPEEFVLPIMTGLER